MQVSGREPGPGSGVRDRRLCADGHGRGPRPRTSHGPGRWRRPVRGLTFAAELSVHVHASARCLAGFPERGGRGGGALMSETVAESVTIAAVPEWMELARALVDRLLGPGIR